MKIAVCDDEQIYIDNIVELLDIFSDKYNIDFEKSTFINSAEVMSSDIKFDIAVLDVEMDNMNGIKLGEKLREQNPNIILIYVTAHKKYLDDALNLNAVRFFEKPLNPQRFFKGLQDAIKRIDNSTISFYLKDQKTMERILAQDIIFVEIENRKTKIVTHNKEYHSNHHISSKGAL